jgi:hypothetical protein
VQSPPGVAEPSPDAMQSTPSKGELARDMTQSTPGIGEQPYDAMQSTPGDSEPPQQAVQCTPSVGETARQAMQVTPSGVAQPQDAVQCTLEMGACEQLQENAGVNAAPPSNRRTRSRLPTGERRDLRAERRRADARRTPCADDATPRRGREHPASAPSPMLAGTSPPLRRVLTELTPWRMPEHESLFGSPTPDAQDCGRRLDLGCDSALDAGAGLGAARPAREQSVPCADGGRAEREQDGWACAACTLLNLHDATRCAVCDALRGSTLASAATLAVQSTGGRPAPHAKSVGARLGGSRTTSASAGRTVQQPSQGQTSIVDFMRARQR